MIASARRARRAKSSRSGSARRRTSRATRGSARMPRSTRDPRALRRGARRRARRRVRATGCTTPHGALARVLLLDQFTRNAFRDTPRAFAGDARALATAEDALDRGLDRALDPLRALVPVHAVRARGGPRRCRSASLALFGALAAETGRRRAPLEWARQARGVIAPLRPLSASQRGPRPRSTPEEIAFLDAAGLALLGRHPHGGRALRASSAARSTRSTTVICGSPHDVARGARSAADCGSCPAGDPPHRGAPHASRSRSRRDARARARGFPRPRQSTRAKSRAAARATRCDTLEALRAEVPGAPARAASSAPTRSSGFPPWHRWRELFDARAPRRRRAARASTLDRSAAGAARGRVAAAPRRRDPAALRATPAGAIYRPARDRRSRFPPTAIRAELARGRRRRSKRCAVCFPPPFWPILNRNQLYDPDRHARMRLNKLQQTAVSALEDIKARDITVLDVRKLTSLYDTLIIASADSNRQVKALAHHVRDKLKEAGATIIGVEGEETGEWVLVDAGDIVVHVMQPAVRAYYNLEELWAPRTPTRARRKPATARPRNGAAAPGAPRRDPSMKLRVVALGHRMPAWVSAGCDDYAKRLPRDFAARARRAEARAARPRQDASRRCSPPKRRASRAACGGARVVALDERGARVDHARARRRLAALARRRATTSRSSSAAPTASPRRSSARADGGRGAVGDDAAARARARRCSPSSSTARRACCRAIRIIANELTRSGERDPPMSAPPHLSRLEQPAPAGAAAPARRRVRRRCCCARPPAASATSSRARATASRRSTTSSASRARRRRSAGSACSSASSPPRPVLRRRHRSRARRQHLRQAARRRRRRANAARDSSGRTHHVLTAVALRYRRRDRCRARRVAASRSRSSPPTRSTATSRPASRSTRPARYAIQGRAAAFIDAHRRQLFRRRWACRCARRRRSSRASAVPCYNGRSNRLPPPCCRDRDACRTMTPRNPHQRHAAGNARRDARAGRRAGAAHRARQRARPGRQHLPRPRRARAARHAERVRRDRPRARGVPAHRRHLGAPAERPRRRPASRSSRSCTKASRCSCR